MLGNSDEIKQQRKDELAEQWKGIFKQSDQISKSAATSTEKLSISIKARKPRSTNQVGHKAGGKRIGAGRPLKLKIRY